MLPGIQAKDAVARLKEHNSGKNRFTKGHIPWRIVYTEGHADWASGRLREKYLKTAAGKKLVNQETARWWWCGFPRTGY